MKVRMQRTAAGPDGVWSAGKIIDLPSAQARALIEAGYAEALERLIAPEVPALEVEAATHEPDGEKAVAPAARPRKRKKRKTGG